MTKKLKSSIEIGFLILLALVAFAGVWWLTYRFAVVSVTILTLAPLVAFWLYQFYQNKFQEETVKIILNATIAILVIPFLVMLMNHGRFESKVDSVFMNGRLVSKMVTEESSESPTMITERRYAFVLSESKDQWKKEALSWYFLFLMFGSPVLTVWLVGKIKPYYDEREESSRRFANRHQLR